MGDRHPDQDRDRAPRPPDDLLTEGRNPLPSGEQWEIRFRDQAAVVVEVGGGLRSYTAAGRELLDGYAATEMCSVARGQVLIPWPNRLQDGTYEWDGEEQILPLTEPARRNSIHGLVRWSSWHLVERSEASLTAAFLLHPTPGYPFLLEASATYSLSGSGLAVTLRGRNRGERPLPFAAGQHPYLRLSGSGIDGAGFRLPAATRLLTDDRGIPNGREPVSGEFDFREGRPLGGAKLDTAFTDLERDPDGLARIALEQDGSRLVAWLDQGFPYVMAFTGDSIPDAGRRRKGLGLEPMTAAPNAFRSGEGLRRLEPGEEFAASWGITPEL